MLRNTAGQHIAFQLLLRADGNDATGLTPSVTVSLDGGAMTPGGGAIVEWETCTEKDPSFAPVYNNLAVAYWRAGRHGRSVAD